MSRQPIPRISVLVVDDHPTLIAGIQAIFEKTPDIYMVGAAGTGDDAIQLVHALHPMVILLDLRMPRFSPSAFEKWVRTNYPDIITLVLTAHDRDAYLATMMDAGVVGYFDKSIDGKQLLIAIRNAVDGTIHFPKEQLQRVADWREKVQQKIDQLTPKELEVLKFVVQGDDNRTIAENLSTTVKTTESHISNILQKLDLRSRQQVIAWMRDNFPEE